MFCSQFSQNWFIVFTNLWVLPFTNWFLVIKVILFIYIKEFNFFNPIIKKIFIIQEIKNRKKWQILSEIKIYI